MKYGRIEHLDRDISRFVLGCDNQETHAHAEEMFDHWFERGGNAFDTANLYIGGTPEKLLGRWLHERGVRDRCVVIVKGAHTPNNFPDAVTRELHESLERLRIDCGDIYLLHRDNPDVPVDEFVDVLNEHLDAGRINAFGGSNWALERVQAANAYALEHGKRGLTVTSNQFSLAEMVNPIWNGCIASSTSAYLRWHVETQTPNFAWSSQARGYFTSLTATGRAEQWDHENAFDFPPNRARRQCAFELAEARGVTAINIAAAYVLCQPFPSFALIGPRTLEELGASLPAVDIELSPDELRYLNLED